MKKGAERIFTPALDDGGRLTLHVARGHEWSNGLGTGAHRSGARVTIADNGSGIQQSELTRIFEPFYSTKGDRGTGLGLWLAHGIVQKHEGSMRPQPHCVRFERPGVFRLPPRQRRQAASRTIVAAKRPHAARARRHCFLMREDAILVDYQDYH